MARKELVAHAGEQIPVWALESGRLFAFDRLGEHLSLPFGFAQVPFTNHSVEDAIPLFLRFVRIDGRIIDRGAGNNPHEQG